MAHLDAMAGSIANYEQREKVRNVMSGPMPKLGIAYLPGDEIEVSYALLNIFNHKEALQGVDPKGYTKPENDKHLGSLHPVSVRICSLEDALDVKREDYFREDGSLDKEAWKAKQDELSELQNSMYDDLRQLKTRAFIYTHHYEKPTGNLVKKDEWPGVSQETEGTYQHCVVIPCSYPTNEPYTTPYDDNPHYKEMTKGAMRQHFKRDTEGSGIMLAYLMAKGVITAEDIETAYGHSYMEEACRRENAELLKAELGLDMPLPTAAKYASKSTSQMGHSPD